MRHITNITENANCADTNGEIIIYGLSKIKSIIVNYTIVTLAGWVLEVPVESMVYLVTMMILRMYAGGYHADTKLKCFVESCMAEIAGILAIRFISFNRYLLIPEVIFFIAIAVLSPIESPNKPLTKNEKILYKRRTSFISTTYVILSVVFSLLGALRMSMSIFITALIVLLMMLVEKIRKFKLYIPASPRHTLSGSGSKKGQG